MVVHSNWVLQLVLSGDTALCRYGALALYLTIATSQPLFPGIKQVTCYTQYSRTLLCLTMQCYVEDFFPATIELFKMLWA
jgi:hypothetical protein